ncbi:pyridoxal phosphate-dependent transferase [Aspergillus pseudonomiae]|nr:pyridoxal phosphate-dependent transferase [Aspergillus pseudonomiae]
MESKFPDDGHDSEFSQSPGSIVNAFLSGQHQWMDQPIIKRWALQPPDILQKVNTLFWQWKRQTIGPFSPLCDKMWMTTAEALCHAGLPWHSNNVNMPNEIDPTWPLHFKHFEQQVVGAKGARVGDMEALGYVCTWDEATQYAIRSLQQELRGRIMDRRPLLLGARMDPTLLNSTAQMLGLEYLHVLDDDWHGAKYRLCRDFGAQHPVIVASTLGNMKGQSDNFDAICEFLAEYPGVLHVDASRNFDFLTTLADGERKKKGVRRLALRRPCLKNNPIEGGTINAATIVAGGMNTTYPPYVVVLRPQTLGSLYRPLVEYVRGTDSTISGSRDSIPPLLAYLQELRFGSCGVTFDKPPGLLDIVVQTETKISNMEQQRWGLLWLEDGKYLFTLQPSVTHGDMVGLVRTLSGHCIESKMEFMPVKESDYPLPHRVSRQIRQIVRNWRVVSKFSGGYPLNHATYSVLGPVLRPFFSVWIPSAWWSRTAEEILEDRKRTLCLPNVESHDFTGSFTTGSTMGNRVGIYTALNHTPDAFIYYSEATHYSVNKIVHDNDILTNRWGKERRPRFAEIACDDLGHMRPDALAQRAISDKLYCDSREREYQVILIVNVGTTFTGAQDDILSLRQVLRSVGADAVYIHADGALDLALSPNSVRLGPPNIMAKNGTPVVQGITLSHHKAYGVMVSGEVVCYTPANGQLATVGSNTVDPRAVFETWLFQQMYTSADLMKVKGYCLKNATLLRKLLRSLGIQTKFNKGSLITLLPRPPHWVLQEFHLAPEGDWVHFITMPHITPDAVMHFVKRVAAVKAAFQSTFDDILPALEAATSQNLTLVRMESVDLGIISKALSVTQAWGEKYHEFRHLDVADFKRRNAWPCAVFT